VPFFCVYTTFIMDELWKIYNFGVSSRIWESIVAFSSFLLAVADHFELLSFGRIVRWVFKKLAIFVGVNRKGQGSWDSRALLLNWNFSGFRFYWRLSCKNRSFVKAWKGKSFRKKSSKPKGVIKLKRERETILEEFQMTRIPPKAVMTVNLT
jgi:hypothetical protein